MGMVGIEGYRSNLKKKFTSKSRLNKNLGYRHKMQQDKEENINIRHLQVGKEMVLTRLPGEKRTSKKDLKLHALDSVYVIPIKMWVTAFGFAKYALDGALEVSL